MLTIVSGQIQELLNVSSSSANDPRQTLPNAPASAIAVASRPVPLLPVAATSTNGAVGSLLAMRMMAVSLAPATEGVKLTVKAISSPGSTVTGVDGVGNTAKSLDPNRTCTLLAARSIASLGRVQIGSKASHPFSPSDMHGQRLTALALGLAAWHSRYMPHNPIASF